MCARACRWRPTRGRAAPRVADGSSAATSPTVWIPRACNFSAVTGPTPQRRSPAADAGSRARRRATTSRPSGLATPLATLARNFVRATPTVMGSPTRSATVCRRPTAIVGCAGDPPNPRTSRNASSIERPSTSGRGVGEHLEHGLARVGVGRHPRWHDDRVRAQRTCQPAAHRRAHAERLGLVAGREHHPAADDHRPPAQARVVALFDRGVERVEIGVQDPGRALVDHVHMFAYGPALHKNGLLHRKSSCRTRSHPPLVGSPTLKW